MGRKETEEAIADSRVSRQFGSVDELLADLNADHTKPRHTRPAAAALTKIVSANRRADRKRQPLAANRDKERKKPAFQAGTLSASCMLHKHPLNPLKEFDS